MNKRITGLLLLAFVLLAGGCGNREEMGKDGQTNTNATMQTILNRKSVRKFINKEIPAEVINDLLRAGMAAPSSRDRRPWEFIVIDQAKEYKKNYAQKTE